MSVNGPLSGIRFTGLGSGLDVESIVSQLVNLERLPARRLQAQQAQIQARQEVNSQFRSRLGALATRASGLNFSSAYEANTASFSVKDRASASVTDAAAPGTYDVNVLRLARAHKTASTARASTTDAAGMAGSFLVNGKAVTVEASDSLTSIAQKVNGANAGVTATVLNGGPGQAFLVFNASQTGAAARIDLSDVSGGVLSGLGVLTGAATVNYQVDGDTARSRGFSSGTASLQSMTGSALMGTFLVNGEDVFVDFSVDSLQSVADRINSATGSSATVVTETVGGRTVSRLEIDATGIGSAFSDPDGVLGALGVLQRGYGNQLTGAQDAQVTIDGVTVQSASNTVSGVLQGVTLNLSGEGATQLTVSRDTAKVKENIKGFMTAYNDVVDFIRQNSSFDSETFRSGALFGDQTASQVENALGSLLFSNLGTGQFRNLTDLGFGLDDQGKLTLDEGRLDSAITQDLRGVKELMMSTGSGSTGSLRYVTSGTKTQAGTYSVEITRAATTTRVAGEGLFAGPAAGGELLTFSGAMFGSGPVSLGVDSGSTLDELVLKINSDSRLKDLVTARNDGGRLQIESKRFGTAGRFTVSSNQPAGPGTSGLGTASVTDGEDVAGTINGEAATGSGQFLLGNSGNATTAGLQIQFTGTSAGTAGTVTFNRGTASLFAFRVDGFTDSVNGILTTSDRTMTQQVEDIDDRLAAMEAQIALREQSLRRRFAAMEEAMARFNSQSGQLGAILSQNRR